MLASSTVEPVHADELICEIPFFRQAKTCNQMGPYANRGLRMTLDLQTHRYTGQFGATAGASVTIQPHRQIPTPATEGIHVLT